MFDEIGGAFFRLVFYPLIGQFIFDLLAKQGHQFVETRNRNEPAVLAGDELLDFRFGFGLSFAITPVDAMTQCAGWQFCQRRHQRTIVAAITDDDRHISVEQSL